MNESQCDFVGLYARVWNWEQTDVFNVVVQTWAEAHDMSFACIHALEIGSTETIAFNMLSQRELETYDNTLVLCSAWEIDKRQCCTHIVCWKCVSDAHEM